MDFLQLLNEDILKELLQESASRNDIMTAMKDRTVVAINYDGDANVRYVEIYAYGLTKGGNPAVIGWLRNNISKTLRLPIARHKIKWRIYRLDKIDHMQMTKTHFDASPDFIRQNRPHFNIGYRNFSQIYYKITPELDPKYGY